METDTESGNLDVLHRLHQGTFMARNLSWQTARELGVRILSGTYTPGEVLPDEASLADELAVSRTVIREAVKILIAKSLLEARPRLGTRVLARRAWQILDRDVLAWQQHISFGADRLLQLTELRRVIEPAAASFAAHRRTGADLAAIERALLDMQQQVPVPEQFVTADVRFHSSVLKAAHNEYFDALEGIIFAGLIASIRITNPRSASNRSSLPLHQAVFDRIAANDAEGAAETMTTLLEDARRRLTAAMRKADENGGGKS